MTEFIAQGRIVWGHPGQAKIKKDVNTKQPKLNAQGQQIQQWVFGLALENNYFNTQILPYLQQEAATAFPHGTPPKFAWKFKRDSDIDDKGRPYGEREGHAGHTVLTISTENFAPQIFKHENGAYRQMDAAELNCGDYVAVKITCKFNGAQSPNTPGLYINPNGIIHIGYGQKIVSAAQDPDEMFAGFQPAQFAGMSATPVMSAAPMPGAMMPQGGAPQGAPAYGQPPQQQPAYGAPAGQPPAYGQPAPGGGGFAQPPAQQPAYGQPPAAQMPPPAHDFVQNAGAPAYGQPPQQQPAYGAPAGQPAYGAPQGAPAYGQPAGQPAYGAPVGGMPGMPQGR